jgi:hypothetical protein
MKIPYHIKSGKTMRGKNRAEKLALTIVKNSWNHIVINVPKNLQGLMYTEEGIHQWKI